MRLTNSCEYGRECAAGQPGAGRFFEGLRKSTGKPPQDFAISHCDDELYWARVTLLNIDDSVEVVEVSGLFGGSSCTACFALPRLRDAGGLTTGAGASSAFMERR
jgi:hypothetical protein